MTRRRDVPICRRVSVTPRDHEASASLPLLDDLTRHGQQTRRGLAQFLPPNVFAGGLVA